MGLLAVLALLLHRTSRQDDVAIGIPIWGRNHPDLEPLIGFFINTLPIRTRFEPQQSFRQLLQQVKASSLAAYDHQELPFEQIVEALNLPRDTSRNPLVQVMLQLIELPEASLRNLEGLAVETIPSQGESSKLDLFFNFLRSSDHGLQGSITYATHIFSYDRMERFCSHLLTLVSSAVQAPDRQGNSLCLLPDSERQLIESWQHGPTIDVPDLCIHQLFEQQVERTPDAIALVFEDQQLTYADLNARSNQLAHHLIDLGVGPEVIVAVCLERSVELIVSLLAILKAGGAYLAIDPSWPEERKLLLLKESRSQILINKDWALSADQKTGFNRAFLQRASQLAYVTYTSGSTGIPKGVMIENRALVARALDVIQRWNLGPGRSVLCNGPTSFDMTLRTTLIPLASGAKVVLASKSECKDPKLLINLIAEAQCDRVSMTPSQWHSLLGSRFLPSAPIHAFATAEPLPVELATRLHENNINHLIHSYGPTEATIYCTAFTVLKDRQGERIAIGHPLPNTTIRILNGYGQPCPIDVPGELHIGGAGLARGYLNNPVLTAEKFIPDPFSSDPTARLYKSGDLASWNPDGTLAFHGRIDQQIKLRGFRIEPGEIETQLLSHPAVAQAVVVLRNNDPNNPRLIAYWVADASLPALASSSSEQLRAFLADHLPDYMVPAAFLQLEALPLTPNGKLDRKALPAPSFSGNPGQHVDPSTDLERQLHAIWSEVLGHSDFGITDNFFAIGGHSLAAARLVSVINQTFQCNDPLLSFFKEPTIRGQLDIILGVEDDRYSCIVPMQPDGDKPPLFIIHGWGGKISGWVHLARAFGPDRPVFGVQSFGADHNLGPQGSIEEITEGYAAEIMRKQPSGTIHLMGYSAGGWYAYAVAKALLERGGHIGMLALLDTYPTLHTFSKVDRLTWLIGLLTRRTGFHFKALLAPSRDEGRVRYIIKRYVSLGFHTRGMLGFELPFTNHLLRNDTYKSTELHKPAEPFIRALDHFTPLSIPIHADIFAPLEKTRYLTKFWRRFILQGVRVHPIFQDHIDFLNSELASELHVELERAMSAKD